MRRNSDLGLRTSAVIAAVVALLCTVSTLDAHIMPEGQGSANLVGKRAYVLLSMPVSVLKGFDDNDNGLLSMTEYRTHAADLSAQVDRLVTMSNGRAPGRTIYQDLLISHSDSGVTETSFITVMRISEWDSTVTGLALNADVFPSRGKSGPRELVFRTTRGDTAEVAILSRSKAEARFFLPALPANKAPLKKTALLLAGLTAALVATAVLANRRRQSVASSLSSAS